MTEREKGKEPEQIVNLTAVVVGITSSVKEDNNFSYEYFGVEEQDTGTSWKAFTIEATLRLTDAPQNKGFNLKKLCLIENVYMRDSKEREELVVQRYQKQVKDLTPGNTVDLRINYVNDYACPARILDLNELREMSELIIGPNLVQVSVLPSIVPNLQG